MILKGKTECDNVIDQQFNQQDLIFSFINTF